MPATAEEVFAFLSRLENHWLLADRFIEVLGLELGADGAARGGRVRMRGPLGLGRTAETRVTDVRRPISIAGTAELSGGSRALVRWTLAAEGDRTRVELVARLERAGALDRALLALGGSRWIRRRFASILEMLADRFGEPGAPLSPPG